MDIRLTGGFSMKTIDISMPIHPAMPVYKGKPAKRPVFTVDSNLNTHSCYETRLTMNLHTGTHFDAPMHMLAGGTSIDQLDLNRVITPCKVLDLTEVEDHISERDLAGKSISEEDFILLKTRNSIQDDILESNFVYLDQSGAAYLKEQKICGVGIDALGIERNQPDHPTHKILLEAGILILEGLRLQEAAEGDYLLYALPIPLMGVEAAPARAILVELEP